MVDQLRALLIAPYFLPRHYGGAVQLYDGLVRRLQRVKMTVLSECQGTPVGELERFDREALVARGYQLLRMRRLTYHFRHTSPTLNLLDGALFFARGYWEFKECLRKVRPDVVICGGVHATGWLLNLVPSRLARMNYVLGEEITQSTPRGPLSRFLRREQVRALRRADTNVVLSRFTAKAVMELGSLTSDRIRLQPGCVDTERFCVQLDRQALRRKWGWSDRTVILTVARLIARKGVDRVMGALALLRSQGRLGGDWLYVIGGLGREEHNLRALSTQLDLDSHVRFLGFVAAEDLPGLYNSADVFILANREIRGDTEGFGLVFLEANASGLPVIGGSAGGTADAIENGVTGIRVDAEDPQALADAIALLMGDQRRREEMRTAGLERVKESFSIVTGAEAFEELLVQVVQEKRGTHGAQTGRRSTST